MVQKDPHTGESCGLFHIKPSLSSICRTVCAMGSSRAFRRDFSRQAQRVNDAAKIFRVLTDAAFSGRQIQQQGIRRTIREHGAAENIRRNRVDNERKRMQLTFQSARIQAVIARAVHAGEIRLSPRGNRHPRAQSAQAHRNRRANAPRSNHQHRKVMDGHRQLFHCNLNRALCRRNGVEQRQFFLF